MDYCISKEYINQKYTVSVLHVDAMSNRHYRMSTGIVISQKNSVPQTLIQCADTGRMVDLCATVCTMVMA